MPEKTTKRYILEIRKLLDGLEGQLAKEEEARLSTEKLLAEAQKRDDPGLTMTETLVAVLEESKYPLPAPEIYASVRVRRPYANEGSMRMLLNKLATEGRIQKLYRGVYASKDFQPALSSKIS